MIKRDKKGVVLTLYTMLQVVGGVGANSSKVADFPHSTSTPPASSTPTPTPPNPLSGHDAFSFSASGYVELLDVARKGYISDMDLFQAIYSVGFEPSYDEIGPILEENFIDPEKVKALFAKYSVDFQRLKYLLQYFRLNKRVRRDDGFVNLHQVHFFIRRMITLFIPVLSSTRLHLFIPRESAREKSVFKLTKLMGFVFSGFVAMTYVLLVLWASDSLTSIRGTEIITIFLFASILIGTQAARESFSWSLEGERRRHSWMFHRFILHYSRFRSNLTQKEAQRDLGTYMRSSLKGSESALSRLDFQSGIFHILQMLRHLDLKSSSLYMMQEAQHTTAFYASMEKERLARTTRVKQEIYGNEMDRTNAALTDEEIDQVRTGSFTLSRSTAAILFQ